MFRCCLMSGLVVSPDIAAPLGIVESPDIDISPGSIYVSRCCLCLVLVVSWYCCTTRY